MATIAELRERALEAIRQADHANSHLGRLETLAYVAEAIRCAKEYRIALESAPIGQGIES